MAERLRRIIGAVPLAVALLIAITVPTGFFLVQLRDEIQIRQFEARLGAGQVARYVYTHATMWQYHGLRIGEIIKLPHIDTVRQIVQDARGETVLETGPPVQWPALAFVAHIVVAAKTVGQFRVEISLVPLLISTGMVTAASWLLAGLSFLAMRGVPLRALDQALGELARQKSLFEAAIENMAQGLCMVDAEQRMAVINRRLMEMFGLDQSACLIGLAVPEAIAAIAAFGHAPGNLCREALAPTSLGGRDEDGTKVLTLPGDGRQLAIDRRRMAQGGWLITVKDISDRIRAEHAETEAALMRERAAHAQEISQAKSVFLATMSHEIRTPMNGVLGLAASLLDEPLTKDQRRVVEAIHESGDSLMRILNDILEFSRLEANRLVFEALPFNPAILASSAESMLGARARGKGLTLRIVNDPALPAAVVGDAGRIRQTLLNLVGNAIKFTDVGEVAIHLRCLHRDATTATLEWRVQDTGIGIPEGRLTGLFAEFTQADGSINRRFGGSGLGLAISRRLIEQMGGTIFAESVLGKGSSFWFRLPLPLADVPALRQPTEDGVPALQSWLRHQARQPRILVAEDNPTNLFVLQRLLASLQLQMDAAADGVEAVAAAAQLPYDVICMDIQMPEMDGLTATRAIRGRGGRLRDVPIIALTGNAFAEDRQACLDAGMNDFLTKPVSKGPLAAALLRALTRAPAVVQPQEGLTAG